MINIKQKRDDAVTMVADSSHLVSAFPRTLAFWARMRVCENNQREREKYADVRIREREFARINPGEQWMASSRRSWSSAGSDTARGRERLRSQVELYG